jgi:hypothetical protein
MLVAGESVREFDELATLRELGHRYRAYRRAQAARLVRMLPREAIRPLYRRACEGAPTSRTDDPLAVLTRYCEELLPLPPFDVWLDDLELYPDGHLRDLDESPEAPTADAPSTVETRVLDSAGRRWRASLRSFRDQGAWRGYIAFQADGAQHVHRTGAIFCEPGPTELRERFLSFEPATLEAFLRSSLP